MSQRECDAAQVFRAAEVVRDAFRAAEQRIADEIIAGKCSLMALEMASEKLGEVNDATLQKVSALLPREAAV